MNPYYSFIERLESRIAPAVLMMLGDFDGDGVAHDLILKGGSGKERIEISDSSAGTAVAIDANGDGDFTDPKDVPLASVGFAVQQFEINLGGGNDIVSVTLVGNYTTPKAFFVNLGGGNNEFHFLTGNNSINGGPLRIDATGGSGNDYLDYQFRNVQSSDIELTAQLGGGADAKITRKKVSGASTILFQGLLL